MQDQELKQQFKKEDKEFEEIGKDIKLIMLKQNGFKIEWIVKSSDINLADKKQEFVNKLYSLMKEYGIFILEAKRVKRN